MPFAQYPVGSIPLPNTDYYPGVASTDPLLCTSEGFIQNPKSPGTRCPTCAAEGNEVWVIPGRNCGFCGTPCDSEHLHD